MKLKQIFNTYVILALFCVLYVLAAQRSFLNKSATYDEPINLTAGYSALVLSDYRIDAIHPPLARMCRWIQNWGFQQVRARSRSFLYHASVASMKMLDTNR